MIRSREAPFYFFTHLRKISSGKEIKVMKRLKISFKKVTKESNRNFNDGNKLIITEIKSKVIIITNRGLSSA